MRLAWPLLLAGLVGAGCGRSDLPLDDVAPEHEHQDAGASPAMSAAPDAAVECTPPVLGKPVGPCTLCDGVYYCPGFPPAPPCGPDLHEAFQAYGPCTTTCIACPVDGVPESDPRFANDAWLWQCNTDGSGPADSLDTFTLVDSIGDPCP